MKSRSSLTRIIGLVILLKSSFTIASVFEPFFMEDLESRSDVTFLNLDSSFFTTSADSRESLPNADVICIQNIKNENSAYDLYELFKTNYPYLLCLPTTSQINGLIIASKYPTESLQFNKFEDSKNEGYVDFDITNDRGLSAHICAT